MSDIKRINGKYYDFGTRNESFLITAKELKTLGIKNYYFMLRIDNPRIADIDPFNPNITKQEIQALWLEYQTNMWIFIRDCVRMRTDKGIVPYCLHRGLAAALWCFERSQDFCLTEPRQTYKTTGTVGGPVLWAFQTSQNMKGHFFGKETDNTKRNLQHLKSNIELLPQWMQFIKYIGDDGKVKKSRQATEKLENGLRKNVIEIHPKPTSLAHAQGMGRGGSGTILYFDEIEFTPYFGEILSNSAPLYKTASDNAAAIGLPHCRIMTTTPGNLDTKEGRDAMPIIESMIPWTEKIYDMTEDQIKEYKSAFKDEYHAADNEKKHTREVIDVFYMEYQYFQVRKDYNWVMEQYQLSGDKMAIRREILLQRLRGSNASPFDPEDIEYLISHMIKSPREMLLCGKWMFKLYSHGAGLQFGKEKDFDEKIPYLVGIDPAPGGGGDNFSVTIVNPYNLKIAAEFKSPYISGPMAVQMLVELVHEHIPNAVLIPEKNSMGIYLIQMLCDTDVKRNLYWSESKRQLEEMTEENGADSELKAISQAWKKYGHWTGNNRNAMFELLFQHMAVCKDILLTEYLVNDICQLIRTPTKRIEADKGQHDDCIMSYLIAVYTFYTGDNLPTFGIYREENPIYMLVENGVKPEDSPDTIKDTQIVERINSPETNLTYDDIAMQAIAAEENKTKDLVSHFDFIHDDVYSKQRDAGNDSANKLVNIGVSFFDSINGIY